MNRFSIWYTYNANEQTQPFNEFQLKGKFVLSFVFRIIHAQAKYKREKYAGQETF